MDLTPKSKVEVTGLPIAFTLAAFMLLGLLVTCAEHLSEIRDALRALKPPAASAPVEAHPTK